MLPRRYISVTVHLGSSAAFTRTTNGKNAENCSNFFCPHEGEIQAGNGKYYQNFISGKEKLYFLYFLM